MATFTQVNSSGQEAWKAGSISMTYTPAASSHTALDCVGGAKTAVIPGGANRIIKLTGYRFSIDTTTPVASTFTAFIYAATPTVTADDATYVVLSADGANFRGTVTAATATDLGSTWLESFALIAGQYINMGVTDTLTIYLQITSTITLEAVAHKLTLFYEIQP